jgi:hypothetical protein
VNALAAIKNRSFECESDKKMTSFKAGNPVTLPEYTADVADIDGVSVHFLVKRNVSVKNELRTRTYANEKAHLESMNNYLNVQGRIWALAIAPEKKRASLYSSNPDINEVPMFCLSPGSN